MRACRNSSHRHIPQIQREEEDLEEEHVSNLDPSTTYLVGATTVILVFGVVRKSGPRDNGAYMGVTVDEGRREE